MSTLPSPRLGEVQREIRTGMWPVRVAGKRFVRQEHIYANDPWPIVTQSIRNRCPSPGREEALALVGQAEAFSAASRSEATDPARPLLLYYCFMNLAKAFVVTTSTRASMDRAGHGLSEKIGPRGRELVDAYLVVRPSAPRGRASVFDEFHKALVRQGVCGGNIDLTVLLPQVVPAHRVWAAVERKRERLVGVERIEFVADDRAKQAWLRLLVRKEKVGARPSLRQFAVETGLTGWRAVRCSEQLDGKALACFEQVATLPYAVSPSDVIFDCLAELRQKLWAAVTVTKPHRRFYLYRAPASERPFVMPQLISAYAVMYYFGSIARYRPRHFTNVCEGDYGAWVHGFLGEVHTQFIYLLASDFARRDITRAPTP